MEKKESNFKNLVNKMAILSETEKGKLKGGFTSLKKSSIFLDKIKNKGECHNHNCGCIDDLTTSIDDLTTISL